METAATENENDNPVPPPPAFSDVSEFSAAFDRRLAEIQAVPEEDMAALNLDVHAAVATVLGALPEIKKLRDDMAKLPNLDMALVDGLEDYAEAAGEANSRYVTALLPPEDIVALNAAAVRMRETFRSDAAALAKRNLIDPERLNAFNGFMGYKNVGFELIDWANLIRDSWPFIEGKTALTVEEVQKAKKLGERLVRAAGQREQAPTVLADAARIRQQALSLLLKAYDEVRRGVAFLRWREDDADTIAPSLYAGRSRKRPDGTGTGTPGTDQPKPAADHAASGSASTSAGGAVHAIASDVPAGLPGAPAFAKA